MPFALSVFLLVSLCVPNISGDDITVLENNHTLVVPNSRPLHRNQTKTARNDQLLSLLASRRREIIQKRFRTHIKNIVDISSGNATTNISKHNLPNASKTINVHLNLSDLLLRNDTTVNDENSFANPSTESNIVNVSSPRNAQKRKHVEPSQVQENKNKNMPIIRNILYRRKMSFLNRKLPLDLEQIAYDSLGLSDINKSPEDLILDNEDSLQVEESNHDKLIYYDVKNNASKKSSNNFEDSSDEIKSMSMNNKTVHNNRKSFNMTTTLKPIQENINKTEVKQNTTKFMSPSLYTYFRPLDVPEEEMQPFLRFGEKLPNKQQRNQSFFKPIEKEDSVTTVKIEEEVDEHMDVSVVKPQIIENKIAKINLPTQKVSVARDYFKNRLQNKKNVTEIINAPKVEKKTYNYRNITRNRGFRNATIFVQNKRSGVRYTINLKGNSSIANLKPAITTELIENATTTTTPINNVTTEIIQDNITKLQNIQLNVNTTIKIPESVATILPETTTRVTMEIHYNQTTTPPTTKSTTVTTEPPTSTTIKQTSTSKLTTIDSTTVTPTTGAFSTAVVTSVSIESSKSRANKTDQVKDVLDFDATLINALNNYTSQGLQNNTHILRSNSSNNIYSFKNISNKTPFILRPTTEAPSTSSFIIHVPDIEPTLSESPPDSTTYTPETTTESVPIIKIESRFNNNNNIKENTTSSSTTTTTTTTATTTTSTSTSTTEKYEETTTQMKNIFNKKPEQELELPLATLFSVTDFKKPENVTKIFKTGSETVISRKETDVSIENIHAAYILAALGFLPMMVIVIYVVRSVMKKKNKVVEDYETEMHDSEKKSIIHPVARLPTLVLDPSNRWEFPRSKLRLQTLLGQGNFGQVWKAEADDLKGHVGLTRLVAVKTIKDGAGAKERDDLLKELAIMQKMGSHPNVVTLLGCCTDKEPYLLIMEYVMYGKLLTFLRDHRTRRDYYNFSDDAATLTARDLTVFAYCVARGMEYLSSKGIIHRDLAARNILVDHNKLCKIADFGMSRDASATGGEVTEPRAPRNALPVRWMAVESLLYSVFTHKTDVWAFGILLWEIVTLGSSPYANMSGREVMRLVCAGYRLERPGHCRPELYGVMARTWVADPAARPTFAELRDALAALLEQPHPDGSYVDLESFRADPTPYEIDNCTPRGNYFTVKSRFSEFECDI